MGGCNPHRRAEGADAVMNLVTADDIESGQLFNGLKPARASSFAYDAANRARLRVLGLQLTGIETQRASRLQLRDLACAPTESVNDLGARFLNPCLVRCVTTCHRSR
jgi:hypothetical protein